jgi:LPS export ABC transporter protein LptC
VKPILVGFIFAVAIATTACNRDKEVIPPTTSALADSADQVMSVVRLLVTDGGVQQIMLKADSAYVFEEGNRIELRTVYSEFFSEQGTKTGTLTSKEGTYRKQRMDMEARDSVVVISTDGDRLETSQLRFDQRANKITSDSAFVLTHADGVTRGVGFVTDPDFTQWSCSACSGRIPVRRPPR